MKIDIETMQKKLEQLASKDVKVRVKQDLKLKFACSIRHYDDSIKIILNPQRIKDKEQLLRHWRECKEAVTKI